MSGTARLRHEGVLITMTSDRRTEVPRPYSSQSQTAHDTHDQASDENSIGDDVKPEDASAHLGAVEGETSAVIPPMHSSTSNDATDDTIDPVDEITPG